MKKTKVVRARATDAEKGALKAIARQQGRRPSETLRELIRAEAQARGLWATALAQQERGQPCAESA